MTWVSLDFVKNALPTRRRDAHKGDFGRVHLLAGSERYTGAAYFAAHAAVRSGSGLVFLHVPRVIWPILAGKCHEAMVWRMPEIYDADTQLQRVADADAVLIGPGLGREDARDAFVRTLIESISAPLVLDADGINLIASHTHILNGRAERLTVLTPHEGEFSRLLGGAPVSDREAQAKRFASEHGCVLVLKGHRTLTAFPDGEVFENSTGNPGMAKGGSGDVLAGMITSLLGQGLPPKRAVPAAVFLHGRAGDLAAEALGEYGMTPTDLLERIPKAMQW